MKFEQAQNSEEWLCGSSTWYI